MKSTQKHKCRICKKYTSKIFCDLGYSPLANSYPKNINKKEIYYPLKVFFCEQCKLPQLPEHQSAKKIFNNYGRADIRRNWTRLQSKGR